MHSAWLSVLIVAALAALALVAVIIWLIFSDSLFAEEFPSFPEDLTVCDAGDDTVLGYPRFIPFQQTGEFAMSTMFSGIVVRMHSPMHLFTGKDFWKTFEDGPWKWSAQQRFAGTGIGCGTHFGLSRGGATAEAGYYDMDIERLTTLELDLALPSVLDLRYRDNCVAVFKKAVENPEVIPEKWLEIQVLAELVNVERGGNKVTDWVGYWARRQGYDGVLFFGARSLNATEYREIVDTQPNETCGFSNVDLCFNAMRKSNDLVNLVVFSGVTLLARTKRYRANDSEWQANPYFGMAAEDIYKLMTYGEAFQVEQEYRFAICSKIKLKPTMRKK
jgi:hypothetical protein